jgi:hypothetical protein
MIVAQKKRDQRIGTANPKGLNPRNHHTRVNHQKTSSTTQDKGVILKIGRHQKTKTTRATLQPTRHTKTEEYLRIKFSKLDSPETRRRTGKFSKIKKTAEEPRKGNRQQKVGQVATNGQEVYLLLIGCDSQ